MECLIEIMTGLMELSAEYKTFIHDPIYERINQTPNGWLFGEFFNHCADCKKYIIYFNTYQEKGERPLHRINEEEEEETPADKSYSLPAAAPAPYFRKSISKFL